MEENERENLISTNSNANSKETTTKIHIKDYDQHKDDGLKSFRLFIKLACVDHSNPWKASFCWSVFFLFCIVIPILSHFLLACSTGDEDHKQPFDGIVQLSLSAISILSYFCLSKFYKAGIKKSLFLDKLCDESPKVRQGYRVQLQKSIKILCMFVLPCFLADSAYRIWWYVTGGKQIPHWGNVIVSHSIAFILDQCSWLYRTSIFFLACVLYRACCNLLILRLEDFAQVFSTESTDVASLLREHLRIRRTLRIISHRFRSFILFTLLFVTASQLASLLVTTKDGSDVDIYTAGEVALCSVTLVTGLCICLGTAAKITHKAQCLTALAAKWHVCATIDSFDATDGETPVIQSASPRVFPFNAHCETDDDEEGDGEDELDNSKLVPTFVNTISFQKRQALVNYLENNRAGITVFGFMLDRSYLHAIFVVELSLVLWLLNKTVGIS